MPPARLDARPEDAPTASERRSISGALFDFVAIPFLAMLILAMICEIVRQLWG